MSAVQRNQHMMVTAACHVRIMENLCLEIDHLEKRGNIWFQQDGATVHIARISMPFSMRCFQDVLSPGLKMRHGQTILQICWHQISFYRATKKVMCTNTLLCEVMRDFQWHTFHECNACIACLGILSFYVLFSSTTF